jgi:hypothetical protein
MSRSVLLPLAGAALLAAALVLLAPAAAPWAALFLLAAGTGTAVLRRNPEPFSWDRLVRAGLLLSVAAGLLLPAAIGWIHAANLAVNSLVGPFASSHWGDLLMTALVLAGLLSAARSWPGRLGDGLFLVAVTTGAIAVKLAWVLLVRMEPVSDFAGMWDLTSKIVEEGVRSVGVGIPATEDRVFLERIYFERIVPYFLPLRFLLGPEPWAYTVPNVLAGAASSWLVYLLARDWFGARPARVAFVLSLVSVETVLAAEIPTHDIPGTLYTLLGLLAFDRAARLVLAGRWRAALAASSAFGVIAVIVGLQRTTGPFFLLSCGVLGWVAVLLAWPRREALQAALVLLVVPLALFEVLSLVWRAADLTVPPEMFARRRGMVLATGTDSWGDGSYAHFASQYLLPYGKLEGMNWFRFSAVKLASDTHYVPSARLSAYLRKARSLFDLGTQTYFYVQGAELSGAGVIEGRREERLIFIARCFNLLFLALFAAGCLRLWASPRVPLLSFVPLFYLSVLSSLLLFLGMVQPRYLYLIWYTGAIYAALPFRDLRDDAA